MPKKNYIMCTIPEIRLNLCVVNEKLNNMPGVFTDKTPKAVMLTLTKQSKKHKWAANAPFPAIIKAAAGGTAVYNAVTGKKEIIDTVTIKQNELGKEFDYKGVKYTLKDTVNGLARYQRQV